MNLYGSSDIHSSILELKKKNFSNFNLDKIIQLIISSSGYNGDKIRDISIKILENYNNWLKKNVSYTIDENVTHKKLLIIINNIKKNKFIENYSFIEYFETIIR